MLQKCMHFDKIMIYIQALWTFLPICVIVLTVIQFPEMLGACRQIAAAGRKREGGIFHKWVFFLNLPAKGFPEC